MQIHVSKIALVGVKDTVGVCRIVHTVEGPALGTTLAGGLRVFRARALAAVEGREVPAGTPVLPDHAVAIGIDTAGSVYLDSLVGWRLIELGVARLWRARPLLDPHQPLVSAPNSGYPKAAIFWIYGDGIGPKGDPVILSRIDWGVGLGPSEVDLAVSIGIDD